MAGHLTFGQGVEFILRPVAREESFAQDHNSEPRFAESLINCAPEAISQFYGFLVIPHLDMLISECLDERPHKGRFVSGRMTDENVVEHKNYSFCRPCRAWKLFNN